MAEKDGKGPASVADARVELRVRYAECDAMGVLHHARYWEYFELARTELLRNRGYRYRDVEAGGVFFVVYKCSCTYKLPIRYDDLVTVRAWVTRQTRTRIDHAYEIIREGRVCCEASTTLACVDRDGRPIIMPEDLWPAGE
ncbi:MAG TPA: thioesterase family protein [Phycisphaerae bacterium]|nr:thioesterase family protein [Phycisphaerae bacterium]